MNAWVEWGEECVTRFNGMFAFALWDKPNRTLFLVRDRYGIKPLYHAQWGNTFIFGSEQKSILQHPIAKKEIDKKALVEYFTFQNIFTNRTLLKNISMLPPASIAKIRFGIDNSLKVSHYWDYHFEGPKGKPPSCPEGKFGFFVIPFFLQIDALLQSRWNRRNRDLGSTVGSGWLRDFANTSTPEL